MLKLNLLTHIHAFSGREWDLYFEPHYQDIPSIFTQIKITNERVVIPYCNCLMYRKTEMCEHVPAALYAIRERNLFQERMGDFYRSSYQTEETMEELDEEASNNEGKSSTLTKIFKSLYSSLVKKKETKVEKGCQINTLETCHKCARILQDEDDPIILSCFHHRSCRSCVDMISGELAYAGSQNLLNLICRKCTNMNHNILKLQDEKTKVKRLLRKSKAPSQLERELKNVILEERKNRIRKLIKQQPLIFRTAGRDRAISQHSSSEVEEYEGEIQYKYYERERKGLRNGAIVDIQPIKIMDENRQASKSQSFESLSTEEEENWFGIA